MRRILTTLVLTSLLVFTFPGTYAQRKSDKSKKATSVSLVAQRGTDTISAAELRDYLTFIASDEMEGRWGFKPAGDDGTYFQRIALRRDRVDSGQTRVEFSGRVLNAGNEYIPVAGSGNVSGQLVFAGNGWLVKSKNIDAYKDIDAKGKIAVVFGSPNMTPRGISRADLGKQGED